eukprot:TRINITY_DN9085_c0_g1_i1.p1 TRINITY_DN9085_c0_g1~~TRINITY_DN9085_c0_g1_i1.p1  ORF type:complete len:469 (+),score=214.35 TRINITY_DN9085_c0_g1_i1:63-1469(+)
MLRAVLCAAALLSIAAGGAYYGVVTRKAEVPAHMTGHQTLLLPNLLTKEVAAKLYDTMKDIGHLPSNSADLKFYETLHEHIGEAMPLGEDGICAHPYLIPNMNRTLCVLPGRIDIARHYMMTGGVLGLKENYAQLVSRLLSFGVYNFNLEKYPVLKTLFHSEEFKEAARTVCPADEPHLDPFQFNYIVQLPGQTVATHLDGVYFWGATRFQFPQWLLAAMKFSGLFEDKFINQVQIVGYIHEWEEDRGGDFVFWNETGLKSPYAVPPKPLTGSAVDGSKTLHAAVDYCPGTTPPFLEKSKENALVYAGDNKWLLQSDNATVRTYTTDDLRVSVVYRARCFRDEEQAERFRQVSRDPTAAMSLETVLGRLSEDLNRKGYRTEGLSRLDLALRILDTYVRYPLPPGVIIPYNYCLLPRLVPSTLPWSLAVLQVAMLAPLLLGWKEGGLLRVARLGVFAVLLVSVGLHYGC